MRQNLRWLDRILRWMFGVALLTWAIAGGPWWGFIGIYFLVTGSFGFCPGYYIMQINKS